MPDKKPIPGRLYKIIAKTNFMRVSTKKNGDIEHGHVVLISYAPGYVGYPTFIWRYILPDGQEGYHHLSDIDAFWAHFEEV